MRLGAREGLIEHHDTPNRDALLEKLARLEADWHEEQTRHERFQQLNEECETLRRQADAPPQSTPQPGFLARFKQRFATKAVPQTKSCDPNKRLAALESEMATLKTNLRDHHSQVMLKAQLEMCRAELNRLDLIVQAEILRNHHLAAARHQQSAELADLAFHAAKRCLEQIEAIHGEEPNPDRSRRYMELAVHHAQIADIIKRQNLDLDLPEKPPTDPATAEQDIAAFIEQGAAAAQANSLAPWRDTYQTVARQLEAMVQHHLTEAEREHNALKQTQKRGQPETNT